MLERTKGHIHQLNVFSGCSLLDVDPGSSTNRTVYTFVGSPEAVVNGALNGAKAAFGLIDMRKHKGSLLFIGIFNNMKKLVIEKW